MTLTPIRIVLPAACMATFAYAAFVDPTMPSLTLTVAGAAACALVFGRRGPPRTRDRVIMPAFLAVTVLLAMVVDVPLTIPAAALMGYAWVSVVRPQSRLSMVV